MLVLSRKVGERIIIGSDIVIEIVDMRSGQVRLGITAPVKMPIHRQEIAERIERERRERDGDVQQV